MCVHTHNHMCTHTHVCVHTHNHMCIHTHVCVHTHTITCVHTHIHMCTHYICSQFKSKFDLPILLPSISKHANGRHFNIDLLKKGTKISHLSMQEVGEHDWIQFRDVLSYTSPCSLDRFLKQWNAPQAKGCFPYE